MCSSPATKSRGAHSGGVKELFYSMRAQSDAISRRHCVIVTTDNEVVVRDLNSRNGTLVNDQRITEETVLLHGDILRVGPLELDLLERSAKRDGRPIDLLPREFRLLEYMMRRHGQLLTRAMLFEEVWNYKFVPQSNLVDVHMGRLRRKVDTLDQPPMIHNVRGEGFVLRAPS